MSKAYQCDRCGCYFGDKKTVYSGAIRIDGDFCPECVRSFEKWARIEDDEIKLGDEVIGDYGAKGVVVGMVTYEGKDLLSLLMKNHEVPQLVSASKYKTKTGRYFPQIVEVLEQLKGEMLKDDAESEG